MKKIDNFAKKIILCIIIIMLVLSCITPVSLGYTQDEVGKAIAGYAKTVMEQYTSQIYYTQSNARTDNPMWNPSRKWGDGNKMGMDCSSFASGCVHAVTGLIEGAESTGSMFGYKGKSEFDYITFTSTSDLKPGDLVFKDGHATIYVGETINCPGRRTR